MKRTLVAIGAIMVLALTIMGVKPGDDTGGDTAPARWQYTGATTAPIVPAGALAQTAACELEFGLDARWCSSLEIVESTGVDPTSIPAGGAWARPAFTSGLHDSATGLTGGATIACAGFGDPNHNGLTVSAGGVFGLASCNDPLPVACCVFRR